jgi:L-fucose isomerase-like protein
MVRPQVISISSMEGDAMVPRQKLVGVVTVSLPGERLEFCEPLQQSLCQALTEAGFGVVAAPETAVSRQVLIPAVEELVRRGVDSVCFGIGTWVEPADVVAAVRISRLPALVVSNTMAASFGFTGASAVHGALDRLGIAHGLFHGDVGGDRWRTTAVPYLQAAAVKNAFSGSTLGLIGGQSPGQTTGNLELSEVLSVFGLTVKQLDQLVVVEEAATIGDQAIDAQRRWLAEAYPSVEASPESLRRAIALWIAMRQVIEANQLTMASVKCLSDAIDLCGSFCLPVALLNSPLRTISCQGDIPATILMECLRLLSGSPAFFGDLVTLDVDSGYGRVINCGACAVGLASDSPGVSWQEQYGYMGKGGGVTSRLAIKPGVVTLASMSRTSEGLRMLIAGAEVEECSAALFAEIRDAWPQGLVRFDGPADRLVQELRSNHVVLGYGDHAAPLLALGEMWELQTTVI